MFKKYNSDSMFLLFPLNLPIQTCPVQGLTVPCPEDGRWCRDRLNTTLHQTKFPKLGILFVHRDDFRGTYKNKVNLVISTK